jgi:RNA polymerase sigma-70 factor, ECF subfamily
MPKSGSAARVAYPQQDLDDSPVPDGVLAERARRRSGAAFATLVARHGDAVYTIARNMCATLGDAEAVLQQTFLAAWYELPRFPAGARFTTWLYGIAMRTALAHRQRDRRPSCSLEPFLPAFDRAGHLVVRKEHGPQLDGSSSERIEVTGLLHEALECMDDQACAAFVLHDLLELKVEEAAAILDTSPRAVRRDAHRSHLMLRGFVDQL